MQRVTGTRLFSGWMVTKVSVVEHQAAHRQHPGGRDQKPEQAAGRAGAPLKERMEKKEDLLVRQFSRMENALSQAQAADPSDPGLSSGSGRAVNRLTRGKIL